MAPARMVAFIEQHIMQCEECLADPDVKAEAEKIREIVLPPSKVPKPKVVRTPKEDPVEDKEADQDEVAEDEDVNDEETEETEDDIDDEDDLEPDDIDDDVI